MVRVLTFLDFDRNERFYNGMYDFIFLLQTRFLPSSDLNTLTLFPVRFSVHLRNVLTRKQSKIDEQNYCLFFIRVDIRVTVTLMKKHDSD